MRCGRFHTFIMIISTMLMNQTFKDEAGTSEESRLKIKEENINESDTGYHLFHKIFSWDLSNSLLL